MSMGTLAKDESDIAIFSVNWAPRLASGETLATSSWTIGAGLTYVSDAIAAGSLKTTVKVSGGSPGQTVGCINTVTTSTGQTLSRTGFVAVRAL